MFDLGKKYNFDSKKEIEGVWESISSDAKLLIARMGNPAFQKAYSKLPKFVQTEIDNKSIDDEEGSIILSDIIGKTILLGWKGIGENGKEIKFSESNAISYLKKYPNFRQLVIDISNETEIFHKNEVEEDLKN